MSLATVDFASSLTWAMLIGWIMSVVLHELGHGVVGYLGGDYTIRERGGLTLNPLQYIDPIFSILVPALIFIVGGVPLPGGVTYIHMELIPKRIWQSAVSAAGPFVNFLIFLGCALPFHPKLHLIDPQPVDGQWSNAILFLGGVSSGCNCWRCSSIWCRFPGWTDLESFGRTSLVTRRKS